MMIVIHLLSHTFPESSERGQEKRESIEQEKEWHFDQTVGKHRPNARAKHLQSGHETSLRLRTGAHQHRPITGAEQVEQVTGRIPSSESLRYLR